MCLDPFMETIRAAGGLLWRNDGGTRRIAVVHRPRRGDWSLPKGKLKEVESWEQAALREVREETGCEARIVSFAGMTCYAPRRRLKIVLYWSMELVRECSLDAPDEVDKVVWLPPNEALKLFDHDSDREVLEEALALRSPGNALEATGGDDASVRRVADTRALWVAIAATVLPASAAFALWLGPPGTGWILLGAGAVGALAGAATALLAGRR